MKGLYRFPYRIKRELFIDDMLLDSAEDLEFQVQTPIPQPPEESTPQGYYSTVIFDDEKYRYYYREHPSERHTLYAESSDGRKWNHASRGPAWDLDRNSAWRFSSFTHNFTPFLDRNPAVPAAERYKGIAGTFLDRGLATFHSPDGVHFKRYDRPLILPVPEGVEMLDSQNTAFYYEAENCYVIFFRVYHLPDGRKLRSVAKVTSPDFEHWGEIEFFPGLNEPDEHFYTSGLAPYYRAPHICVGTPTRFFEEHASATDIGLFFYRAGAGFVRPEKGAWIRPGLAEERWMNRANYLALNPVPTAGDEMSFYHIFSKVRYTLPPDRFVSLHAGMREGMWISRPIEHPGGRLELNAATSAGGRIVLELCDPEGNTIPGYSAAEFETFWGDRIAWYPQWRPEGKKKIGKGDVFRIRAFMKEADVFSISFCEPEIP